MSAPSKGFTLLELVVALAIAGALLIFAIPGWRAYIADLEIRDRVDALVEMLSLARSEAIRRNGRVNLCPSADQKTCSDTGAWETGWLVYVDLDDDGAPDAAERIVRVEGQARPGITIRGNRPVSDYVSYTPTGHTRMRNGALQMGTFTICRTGQSAVHVVLANGGRVRVDRTGVACP